MLPKSDDLEALYSRAKKLSGELGRMRGAEVGRTETKDEAAAVAREWLRISPGIQGAGCCKKEVLDRCNTAMTELLASTTTRARASALKKKLDSFLRGVVDEIIVPIIQVEGSPRQVAARQVQDALSGSISPEESAYVEEAARCLTVECYRAAIIMLWAAAVARIHSAVMKVGFNAFNHAVDTMSARKRAPFNRIKDSAKLTSLPELQRSRDADLLILGMELFGYDLQSYQELDRLLGLRNDCAHPGMNRPGALDVQQFGSKLRDLVFDRITL